MLKPQVTLNLFQQLLSLPKQPANPNNIFLLTLTSPSLPNKINFRNACGRRKFGIIPPTTHQSANQPISQSANPQISKSPNPQIRKSATQQLSKSANPPLPSQAQQPAHPNKIIHLTLNNPSPPNKINIRNACGRRKFGTNKLTIVYNRPCKQ